LLRGITSVEAGMPKYKEATLPLRLAPSMRDVEKRKA
jgi:hypothetical protein